MTGFYLWLGYQVDDQVSVWAMPLGSAWCRSRGSLRRLGMCRLRRLRPTICRRGVQRSASASWRRSLTWLYGFSSSVWSPSRLLFRAACGFVPGHVGRVVTCWRVPDRHGDAESPAELLSPVDVGFSALQYGSERVCRQFRFSRCLLACESALRQLAFDQLRKPTAGPRVRSSVCCGHSPVPPVDLPLIVTLLPARFAPGRSFFGAVALPARLTDPDAVGRFPMPPLDGSLGADPFLLVLDVGRPLHLARLLLS